MKARKPSVPRLTEAEFTRQVLAFARLHGWRTAHFRPGMTSKGRWVTAVQGDGVGFPDILFVRGKQIIVAELKVGSNKATAEQMAWLEAFAAAGVIGYLWRPSNWNIIESILGGK